MADCGLLGRLVQCFNGPLEHSRPECAGTCTGNKEFFVRCTRGISFSPHAPAMHRIPYPSDNANADTSTAGSFLGLLALYSRSSRSAATSNSPATYPTLRSTTNRCACRVLFVEVMLAESERESRVQGCGSIVVRDAGRSKRIPCRFKPPFFTQFIRFTIEAPPALNAPAYVWEGTCRSSCCMHSTR